MKRINRLTISFLSFSFLFFVWFMVTAFTAVPTFFLPSPIDVGQAIVRLFVEYGFVTDVWMSVIRICVGFVIAAVLAIPLGIFIAMHKHIQAGVLPLIDFIRYTPVPAFIPLFILWFGIGEVEKVVVIASSVFFQLVLMVVVSVQRVPRAVIESAQTLGVQGFALVKRIIFPYVQPFLLDDLRISFGWAWAGLIMAELVGASSGIGYVIIQSQRLLQTANVMGAIVVVGVLGLCSDVVFRMVRRKLYRWV